MISNYRIDYFANAFHMNLRRDTAYILMNNNTIKGLVTYRIQLHLKVLLVIEFLYKEYRVLVRVLHEV